MPQLHSRNLITQFVAIQHLAIFFQIFTIPRNSVLDVDNFVPWYLILAGVIFGVITVFLWIYAVVLFTNKRDLWSSSSKSAQLLAKIGLDFGQLSFYLLWSYWLCLTKQDLDLLIIVIVTVGLLTIILQVLNLLFLPSKLKDAE